MILILANSKQINKAMILARNWVYDSGLYPNFINIATKVIAEKELNKKGLTMYSHRAKYA